jgi:acetyl-CoA C-acetyltransferase
MTSNSQREAYIYGGFRSPFGKHGGSLAALRPDDLAAMVIKGTLDHFKINPSEIDDVILGCANQAGEDSRNVARNAVLASGLPTTIPGITVNRLCASGLAAVVDAARAIKSGDGQLFIAGGVESMTRAPFVMGKADSAYSRELKCFDTTIGSRFPNQKVMDQYGAHSMPETGDEVARDLKISRNEADQFAARSQEKFEAARARGFFDGEILPITLPGKGKNIPPTIFSADEGPRPGTGVDKLSALKPLFSQGIVTAGNASSINDGAAALVIADQAFGAKYGVKPLVTVVGSAAFGVDPRIMGLGPVNATKKLLSKLGLSLKDMDIIEINEAFATQVLGCLRGLEIAFDDSRVNPNGGAIAVGHPLGASGARLALTASRQLCEGHGRYALVSLCVGMGQGLAVILKRV